MSWSSFIPTSLLALGAILLVLAVFLVFLDVPGKGVPWDKIGAGFAFVGGFGVGGAAGGWLGQKFSSMSGSVLTNGQKFTAQVLGAAVVVAIIFGLLLWAYSRVRGKGIATKSKIRGLLVVGVLALVGTLFAVVPGIYGALDKVVHSAGTALVNAVGIIAIVGG